MRRWKRRWSSLENRKKVLNLLGLATRAGTTAKRPLILKISLNETSGSISSPFYLLPDALQKQKRLFQRRQMLPRILAGRIP